MSETPVFTQQDIEVLHEETLYRGFFELKRVQFRHKLFAGGMSGIVGLSTTPRLPAPDSRVRSLADRLDYLCPEPAHTPRRTGRMGLGAARRS